VLGADSVEAEWEEWCAGGGMRGHNVCERRAHTLVPSKKGFLFKWDQFARVKKQIAPGGRSWNGSKGS
jgi:hypothetical protein